MPYHFAAALAATIFPGGEAVIYTANGHTHIAPTALAHIRSFDLERASLQFENIDRFENFTVVPST